MKSSFSKGFTLIELIFVIVIIGVLSAVAIPQFKNLTDNAKISSELATASSVQSAIDATHGDWITNNTCTFDWGDEQNSSLLNTYGYPSSLDDTETFGRIFKTKTKDWVLITCPVVNGNVCYRGPASLKGDKNHKVANKPNKDEWWEYNTTAGTFTLIET